jgi:glycosyltransferase involved in cell wall biosynthesis
VVITIHDMIHELTPSFQPSVQQDKHVWCQRADHIVAISQATCDDLMRVYDVPARKISVVHHGASLLPNEHTFDRPVPGDFILYVGTRGHYKNFRALAAAYAAAERVRDRYRFVCFGGGPLTADEVHHLSGLGILDRIDVTRGSDELLARFYRHARALVYPSLQEGFGLPLVEAMLRGCPVLCSDIRPFREIVAGAGCYFDPKSVTDMAVTLNTGLSDERRLAELGERGRDRSRLFTWERCAKHTADIYHSLANR